MTALALILAAICIGASAAVIFLGGSVCREAAEHDACDPDERMLDIELAVFVNELNAQPVRVTL